MDSKMSILPYIVKNNLDKQVTLQVSLSQFAQLSIFE